MRKSAEFSDSVTMGHRILQIVLKRLAKLGWTMLYKLLKHLDRALLDVERLGMHERHVKKRSRRPRKPLVIPRIDSHDGELTSLVVRRPRERGVSKQVAGELIEHDDEPQSPVRTRSPSIELAGSRSLDGGAELGLNLGIKRLSAPEPPLGDRRLHRLVEGAVAKPKR